MTDITNLSPWLIEVVKAQQDLDRGSFNFSILKDNGEVVGMRSMNNRVISFRKGDNKEVMAMIADIIAGIGNKTGEFKLTLDSRKGKIRRLIISTEEQKNIGNTPLADK